MTTFFSGISLAWSKKDEHSDEIFNLAAGSGDEASMESRFRDNENDTICSESNHSNGTIDDVSLAPTCLSFDEYIEEEDIEDVEDAEDHECNDTMMQCLDYSYGDHADFLFLRRDDITNQHYHCDVSHFFVESRFLNLVTEFCCAFPLEQLDDMFVGLEGIGSDNSASAEASLDEQEEPLPLRILTMRLRPDTGSSEIIEAVQEACGGQPNSTVTIEKQHKTRWQCLISTTEDMRIISSFLLDAQICTRRRSPFERELIIRIFPGAAVDEEDACLQEDGELLTPLNQHMQQAAAFVYNMVEAEKETLDMDIYLLPCLEQSPGSTSAKLSKWIQDQNETGKIDPDFPTCLFHTIDEVPLFNPQGQEKNGVAPVFDPIYCSQLSLLSQEETILEVEMKMIELEETSQQNLEQHAQFQKFIRDARKTYGTWETAALELVVEPRPELDPFRLPAGYTFLAMKALKEMKYTPDCPSSLADEAVANVYHACSEEGRKAADEYFKKGQDSIIKEMVDIQTAQVAMLQDIEYDLETQKVAREFGRRARKAINIKGRVERRLKGRVPMLTVRCWGAECIITSTSMLCVTKYTLKEETVDLFDLKAISVQKTSSSTVLITALNDGEPLYELQRPRTNVDGLLQFVHQLQDLQNDFASTVRRDSSGEHRF
ncbi:MAG: hypothetical protein SGILL_000101 [Bacillariaceae sp.]